MAAMSRSAERPAWALMLVVALGAGFAAGRFARTSQVECRKELMMLYLNLFSAIDASDDFSKGVARWTIRYGDRTLELEARCGPGTGVGLIARWPAPAADLLTTCARRAETDAIVTTVIALCLAAIVPAVLSVC
jgi:hypothetical protein